MAMQALWLLMVAGVLLWVFQTTDIDRQIAHLFFDEQQRVFPLRRTWLFEDLLHHSAKQVTYLAVAASLYVCYLGYRGALEWLPPRNALLAALGMLLIPLGMMIGAPLAFWRMDGSVPLVILPLLGLATVIAALAARALWEARMGAGLVLGLLAAVPLSVAGFKFGMPQLEGINLSRRLADVAKAQNCKDPRYATVGYREPSLVFLTDTKLLMPDAAGAAAFIDKEGVGCRIAFIEKAAEADFRAALQGKTAPALLTRVRGVNINAAVDKQRKLRVLDIAVYVRR